MVAESSSVNADRSDTLLFDVITLSRTSLTTVSIRFELWMIVLKISCNFPMKRLMPLPTAATSWFSIMVTRLVRSPSLLSIPSIISLISFFVLESGTITIFSTENTANSKDAMLTAIVTKLTVKEYLYTLVNCCFAVSALLFTTSWIAVIFWSILSAYSEIAPFAKAYAASLFPFALYAIRFAFSYFKPS